MPERIKQALSESESRFFAMVEKNADAIMIVRGCGVVCYANPAAGALLGRADGDLVGESWGVPLSPDDVTEITLPHRAGEPRIADMRVAPIMWEGEPAYLASLRDITERRRAAEALAFLAEASRRLAGSLDVPTTAATVAHLAVEHLADWCTVDLLEGDLLDGERRVQRLAAAHALPLLQARMSELRDVWTPDWATASGLPHVLAGGDAQLLINVAPTVHRTLAHGDERRRLIQELGCRSLMLVPLIARGSILGSIMFALSATTRRYRDADLALAKDLAHRAALAIDNARLYDQSQDAVRRRDEFLAMLSHELRNPLAAIHSAVDVMRKHAAADMQNRARDIVERQGQHMARLLDELLDIARVTRGKIELRRELVDLRQTVDDALQAVGPSIAAQNHELAVTVADGPLHVWGDATRIEQIIANLLDNAAKYTSPGGRIELLVESEAQQAVLRIRDNGVGIAPDDLPHIFDLFVQADATLDRRHGGLGVGLTLVRTLVELHGGSVGVDSAGRGQGCQFTVRLPLAECGSDCVPAPAPPDKKQGRRIVIVEDNDDARDMLKVLLEMDGHQVQSARDGQEGIDVILAERPDVALVDIGLPGVDGYGVARQVRAKSGRQVRLVAVTGYGQLEDTRRARAAGFDDHLVKPVQLEVLSDLLREEVAR